MRHKKGEKTFFMRNMLNLNSNEIAYTFGFYLWKLVFVAGERVRERASEQKSEQPSS